MNRTRRKGEGDQGNPTRFLTTQLWFRIYEFVLAGPRGVRMVKTLKVLNKASKHLTECVFDHSYRHQLPLLRNCNAGHAGEVTRLLQNSYVDSGDASIPSSLFATASASVANMLLDDKKVRSRITVADLNAACQEAPPGIVLKLLEYAMPDDRTLIVACQRGNYDMVKNVLHKNATPGCGLITTDALGRSLTVACENDWDDIVDILLFATPDIVNPDSQAADPVWVCACNGSVNALRRILAHPR